MPIAAIRRRGRQRELEALEGRILLSSVISVSPGYQDATQAIQNALNSAGSGGAVNLAPGSYNVSSMLTIPSGVTLEGSGKATLDWTGSGMGYLLYSPWDGVGTKVDGLTLNGAGYKLDPDGTNLTISNNTFENISFADSYYGNGLYIPDQETGTIISGNAFNNITGNLGIYIFNAINTQIINNSFTSDGEAIKGQWSNGGANCSISNNTLSEIYRFGIECQGNPTNFTISSNTLGNWQQNAGHIGLSIATGEGTGINITNNVILGTGISNPNTADTAIEAMGDNLTISGNFASGWGWAELVGFTDNWATENNTWGVDTAVWVLEAGGVNPSIDSGNTMVALDAVPSGNITNPTAPAASPPQADPVTPAPAPPATTAPATTSTPTTNSSSTTTSSTSAATTTTTAAPPTTAPTVSSTQNTPTTQTPASPAASTAAPTSATPTTFSNSLYTVAGNGSDALTSVNGSTFACQTASAGTLSLIVRASNAKRAAKVHIGITIRSSLHRGSAHLSLKSATRAIAPARSRSAQITKRLRVKGGFLYLRLASADGAIQGEYSTDGTDFSPVATIKLNA